ncbi:MAG: sigma 54-interacting transcriptional regulator [Deltaproteobacteria bacterium]|jgi:Nif-specific regulatory protein|nr:sigma 54-interacting transcriptional regulator [Deltaproteobacteria bacterium]
MNEPQGNMAFPGCLGDACGGKILGLLLRMGRSVSGDKGLSAAMDRLLEHMREEMGIRMAFITVKHRGSGTAFVFKSTGLTSKEEERGVYRLGEGITGKAAESGRPIIVPRIGEEPGFLNRTGALVSERDRELSFICLPLTRGEKVLGTLCAARRYPDREALDRHVDILTVMTLLLATTLDLYILENLDRSFWEKRARFLVDELKERYSPANIVGTSSPMREVYRLVEKVAPAKTTVLLLGESGVGKERVANSVHYSSPRAGGPFVKFNCAALPESLAESELFGHEKGSFTGAVFHKGRFEDAEGGSIFLDEVGELPMAVQSKLLRVLQDRSFERVGGNRTITADVRIIAATNRDLEEMIRAGLFREDLYYRLNVFPVLIPPLRERGAGDIESLARSFVGQFAEETEKGVKNVSSEALDILAAYPWPGNVRELENVIQRAVVMAEGDTILSHDLPLSVRKPASGGPRAPGAGRPLDERLESIEYEMLVESLRDHRGNITEAAQALGLTRRVMGLRMQKFNISYRDFRRNAPAGHEDT